MKLFGSDYTKRDLLRRIGALSQVGGIEMHSLQDGHARGTRLLDIRTGSGFRCGIMVDRGMDIGPCEFRGVPLGWIAPKGFAAPAFFDPSSEHGWLRHGLSGLLNTAGLITIGGRQTVPTGQYNQAARMTDVYGTHDRIAVTPASRVNYGEAWDDDRCSIWAEGVIQEDIAYGENISLRRRFVAQLGSSCVAIHDVVRNDGFYPTPHQMLYHFNVGFPIVDEGSELIGAFSGPISNISQAAAKNDGSDDPERFRHFSAPQSGYGHEGFVIPLTADGSGFVTVAIVNRHFREIDGGLGVYLRYEPRLLPVYIEWRMMAEGLYVVGMEPATNPFLGISELIDEGYPVMLGPGETREYLLEFGVLTGGEAIEEFERNLPPPHGRSS